MYIISQNSHGAAKDSAGGAVIYWRRRDSDLAADGKCSISAKESSSGASAVLWRVSDRKWGPGEGKVCDRGLGGREVRVPVRT